MPSVSSSMASSLTLFTSIVKKEGNYDFWFVLLLGIKRLGKVILISLIFDLK